MTCKNVAEMDGEKSAKIWKESKNFILFLADRKKQVMGVRENKVERHLDLKVKSIGGITRKWISPGHDGVPDRIVIFNSIVWFVEVKTIDGEFEPSQPREHKRLRDCGANVVTVYGERGVDRFVKWINSGYKFLQCGDFK